MISGVVAQILLFLLGAAIIGFLSGWFLGRQREAELLAELAKQRGLEDRLAGRITQLIDGLGRPPVAGEAQVQAQVQEAGVEPRATAADVALVRDEVVGLRAVLEGLQGGQADFAARLTSLANGLITIQSMRVDVRPLEHRLETLGSEVQRSLTPDFAWVKEDIGGVKRDVGELRSVAEAVKGEQLEVVSRLSALHEAVDGLRTSLPKGELVGSLAPPDPGFKEALAGLKGEAAELVRCVNEVMARGALNLSGVEKSVGALEALLGSELGRLKQRLDEVASRLDTPLAPPELVGLKQGLGAVQSELGALGRALESLRGLERKESDTTALEAKVEGIRGSVESLKGVVEKPQAVTDLSPLAARVEALAAHVESLRSAVGTSALVDVSALQAGVDAVAAGLDSLRTSVDLGPLEARVGELAASLESFRGAAPSKAAKKVRPRRD